MISVVIPVYGNAGTIEPLLDALTWLHGELSGELEVVFVVDGSPDDSALRLRMGLPKRGLNALLLELSRNFGAFAAIRAGLEAASGDRFAVLAADMQEPIELIEQFDRVLRGGGADIVIGTRASRADPFFSRVASGLFWWAYRKWVQRELPPGGVDIFACSRQVRDEIARLNERNSSLVGLLFWVGFRREYLPYHRRARPVGRSAWTFTKKLRYLSDSVFNFTDLPVRFLFRAGVLGILASFIGGVVVLGAKFAGQIPIPGYTPTVLAVTFFGALNCFGIGVIGGYVWRTLENTKGRPSHIVASRVTFGAASSSSAVASSAAEN